MRSASAWAQLTSERAQWAKERSRLEAKLEAADGAKSGLVVALKVALSFIEDDSCRHTHEKAGALMSGRVAVARYVP